MANYQNSQASPKAMLKTIPIIHLALLVGQVLFAIVAFTQVHVNTFYLSPRSHDSYLYVVPIMAIASFLAGNLLFRQLLGAALNKPTVQQKLTGYLSAMLVRFAMLEGASLFGIVTYLLTGNLFYISISGLIVVYFVILKPTRDKIETDLNLDYQEKAQLDNDDIETKY